MCAVSIAGDLCITSVNLQPVPTPIVCTTPAASVMSYPAATCTCSGPCPCYAFFSLYTFLFKRLLFLWCSLLFSRHFTWLLPWFLNLQQGKTFGEGQLSATQKAAKHTPKSRWLQAWITTSFVVRIYPEMCVGSTHAHPSPPLFLKEFTPLSLKRARDGGLIHSHNLLPVLKYGSRHGFLTLKCIWWFHHDAASQDMLAISKMFGKCI